MDLRNLPEGLDSANRCEARRELIEKSLDADLSALKIDPKKLGNAEEKNCEQMFGHVPIPVGLAGPLSINFTNRSGDSKIADASEIYLPLATTEGALVASVNRGCKAITESGGVTVSSKYHGMTRSIAFQIPKHKSKIPEHIRNTADQWKKIGEDTSSHLKIMNYTIDETADYLFLTINCDTDEAMGMNMVTIAAQAIGSWLDEQIKDLDFVTVAGNVDSDKKPSQRTHDNGRGYEATAEVILTNKVITEVLKATPEAMLITAHAKLDIGSRVAGAIGSNLQAANIIAALYLATGQDIAHTVEGSLADTHVFKHEDGLKIAVRCPAILVGVRGGGTNLPAQKQCLDLLLRPTPLPVRQAGDARRPSTLAEIIAAAVLAGEISLLAAQATHTLAESHSELAR
ncbi:MAG: hypothetical protein K9M03_02735 [Kiritimatiellales bacterium]|nr:hypothetical protein [Kiritimatiellales bacterium]